MPDTNLDNTTFRNSKDICPNKLKLIRQRIKELSKLSKGGDGAIAFALAKQTISEWKEKLDSLRWQDILFYLTESKSDNPAIKAMRHQPHYT